MARSRPPRNAAPTPRARRVEALALVQEALGTCTWVWDVRRDRVRWHGDPSQLLGLAHGTLPPGFRDYFEHVHPDDRAASRAVHRACLKGERQAYRTEERIVWPDGTVRWLETYARGRYDKAGRALELSGVMHDCTERKLQELKYKAVFDTVDDAIAIARARDSVHLEMNPAWERYTGHSRARSVGRSALDLGLWIDPAERTEFMAIFEREGRVSRFATRFRHADGREMDVVLSGTRLELQGERCVLWSWSDVTGLRRAEGAARESAEHFASVFENSPDPIAISRVKDARIVAVNDAWVRANGYARADAVGRTAMEVGVLTEVEREAVVAQLRAEGRLLNRLVTFVRADGTPRQSLMSTAPIEVAGERCVMWLGRDVTELQRVEAALRELNATLEGRVAERTAALEAANKELESFTYSVSHDLRSPLRAIAGQAAMIREDFLGALPPEARERFGRLEANAVQMGELIDDLLEFSRTGRVALDRRPHSMRRMVDEVVGEVAAQGQGEGAPRIEVGDLPDAPCDAPLMRQVWRNLVGNAVKFVRGAASPRVAIGGRRDGDVVEYWVEDNGAGFDMQYASRLFGVFQRLHRHEEFEGTGVGLAIVQRIVQRHGGTVAARGEPGRGARFSFTLPA